jgi:hypothetical protein
MIDDVSAIGLRPVDHDPVLAWPWSPPSQCFLKPWEAIKAQEI